MVLSGCAGHVVAVIRDQLVNVLAALAGVRPGVGDCAAESDIVAYHVDAIRILEQVLDVLLPYTEISVDVAPVVCFLMIAHRPAP